MTPVMLPVVYLLWCCSLSNWFHLSMKKSSLQISRGREVFCSVFDYVVALDFFGCFKIRIML